MKNILLTIITFTLNTINAQNIDKIKKSDTLYVYFEKDHKQYHKVDINPENKRKTENYYYIFYGKTIADNGYVVFGRTEFSETRKEKKSFLKLNKDTIITFEFLTQFDLIQAINIINPNRKTIFLIDKKDMKCGKILLKEVRAASTLQLED
ncbi:hypothetical protein E0I26_11835 [Flavobacterium rhamnosiphilum]|uniref:Uncharacterized protein n=1 Tax=Flavobacterium rhamnosiphilum TaxID=2541724 RepID=A0A4R5F5Z9_9FLAO|nr:hypothetical protein [Flavobacterium rhamnosiphilum]TDE43295.1 hypothetical protein E0I26_11835 [Flavobacterium rhamnosiphilum]